MPWLGSFGWLSNARENSLNYPFSDTFTRGNGALGDPWVGGTWTISTNKAINTPTPGLELVTNGDFAAWTGDNPDGWTLAQAETGGHYVTEDAGKCRYVCDAGQVFIILQTILANKKWYTGSVNITARASGGLDFQCGSGGFDSYAWSSTGVKIWAGRALGADLRLWSETAAADLTIDNISAKELTLSELMATVPTSAADVVASVNVTTSQGLPCGLVMNLDSAVTPANFVLCYVHPRGPAGEFAILEKCVAGTYTTVATIAIGYGAGRTLSVTKSGSTYTVSYNGSAVGTPQTISDAGIIGNKNHGMFSMDASALLDNFSLA